VRFLLPLILNVLVTACAKISLNTDYQENRKSELLNEISSSVFKQLKKEKNLCPVECGGRMMDQITLMHWGFFYYKDISIEEARKLLMLAASQFLETFNADGRIRPYLATHPFKPENIEIRIFLKKPDGSELGPEKLHVISMIEGVLRYKIESSEDARLKTVHKETYNEAASKLNAAVGL
jgi:hypothetical protein